MTVLGKILVFVVLVLSLLWTFLTVSSFAARTNWQAQAKRYQDEAQKAGAAATAMKALLDAEREGGDVRVAVIREDRERFAKQVETIALERDGLLKEYNALLDTNKRVAAEQAPLIGQKEKLIAEVALKDDQIRDKDKRLNELTFTQNEAVVKANERANEARAQTDRANRLTDQVNALQEALETLRRNGGAVRPGVAGQVRVPAPERFRASVVSVDQSSNTTYVTINLGLDSGLQKNTELTVQRLTGSDGQFLGRLVITQVDPKQAIGTFTSPRGIRPTAADLPRAGDLVTGSSN